MKSRNISIDVLKFVLAVFVVGLHCEVLKDVDIHLSNFFVNGVFRVAVPLFLIINGYYYHNTPNKFIWYKRLLGIYFFWMIFYSPIWFDLDIKFVEFSQKILFGYYHLWYVVGLIGGAVVISFLTGFGIRIAGAACSIFAIFGILGQYNSIFVFVSNDAAQEVLSHNFVFRNFLLFSAPLFFVGWFIRKYDSYIKPQLSALIFALGLFAFYFEYNFVVERINYSRGFNNYASLYIICPAIFLLIKNTSVNIGFFSKNLDFVSSAVFFLHPIFIYVIKNHFSDLGQTHIFFVVSAVSIVFGYFLSFYRKSLRHIL